MAKTLEAKTLQCGVFLAVQNIQVNYHQIFTSPVYFGTFHYNQENLFQNIYCAQTPSNNAI